MDLIAQKVETAMAALVRRLADPGTHVYASHEPLERLNPCVIISARKVGDDYRVRTGSRVASTLSLTFTSRVHASLPEGDRIVEAVAKKAAAALEAGTAEDVADFDYFQALEPTEQPSVENGHRIIANGWTVTARLKP